MYSFIVGVIVLILVNLLLLVIDVVESMRLKYRRKMILRAKEKG